MIFTSERFTICVFCILMGSLPMMGGGGLSAAAQEADTVEADTTSAPLYRVETVDGNRYLGTLVSKNEQEIVVDTREAGEVTLRREDVSTLREVDRSRLRDGEYWFENPFPTRHFFAPTAIGLRGGRGYYQNTWVLLNDVNYGITDNVSIGGGAVPLFLFGAPATPVWLLPKVTVSTPREHLHVGAGALAGTVLGEESGGAGVVYGLTTVGGRDKSVTLGVGYGYAGSEWSRTPAVNLSTMLRLGRTTYFVSENYFFPGTEGANGVISAGVRWAPESFAVDFGLFRPVAAEGSFIGAPWLGVTLPFGR
jgi:hypothetical protein